MRRFFLLSAVVLTFAGCGVPEFVPPESNPSLKQDLSGSFQTLSATADRRLIYVPIEGKNKGRFCAEASPDVVASVDSSFDSSTVGSLSGISSTTENLSDVLSDAVTTSDAALLERTQGLQFYRDGLFSLCQAYLNGFLGEGKAAQQEYIKQYWALRTQTMALAKVEIQGANWGSKTPVVVTAPAATAPATVTNSVSP